MEVWLMTAAANLCVGALVGLCGVAGFLLPMFYTAALGMSVSESLALSFAAFILSGALGSLNYRKAGNLNLRFGLKLSAGSLLGAVLGVKLNFIIPEEKVKLLLYAVVLLSGISILLRKEGGNKEEKRRKFSIEKNLPATLLLGFVTGALCAMSGAGGPVLVMPLLVAAGIPVRTAVGAALFNSVFIGIPSAAGYLSQCSLKTLLPVLLTALAAHGIGVYWGSKNAVKIRQGPLKKGVAIFSIVIALCKLTGIF